MSEWPVQIIRSERRRRTVQALLTDGRIEVRVPAGLDPSEESRLVEGIVAKVVRKQTSASADLVTRATFLARKHDLPEAESIVWSSRQNMRWGSCTPGDKRIRISDRIADAPAWVVDSVIVHELAHIVVRNHGPEFQELVGRYELTERARGYLMAMGEGRRDR
ncbi:MAG TPA: M48 family metallopeptidase [Acidimicrobiia bacterium]